MHFIHSSNFIVLFGKHLCFYIIVVFIGRSCEVLITEPGIIQSLPFGLFFVRQSGVSSVFCFSSFHFLLIGKNISRRGFRVNIVRMTFIRRFFTSSSPCSLFRLHKQISQIFVYCFLMHILKSIDDLSYIRHSKLHFTYYQLHFREHNHTYNLIRSPQLFLNQGCQNSLCPLALSQ